MGIYLDKYSFFSAESERLSAREISEKVAFAADSSSLAGSGGFQSVWLEPSLSSGENYSARILGNRVEVSWSRGLEESPLTFSNINGTGLAELERGKDANFTNYGGVVSVLQ